jgi:hypothetical protein
LKNRNAVRHGSVRVQRGVFSKPSLEIFSHDLVLTHGTISEEGVKFVFNELERVFSLLTASAITEKIFSTNSDSLMLSVP